MFTFTPPTYEQKMANTHTLFQRFPYTRGYALLKTGDTYVETTYPSQHEMDAADVVYLGSHIYEVSADEAADLIAAGYTVTES